MAGFTFATAGAALGSALGLGSNVGWLGGHLISRLFNKNKSHHIEGKRLQDLSIQSSTYGRSIPIVYGQAIIGCNIIWSNGIKESAISEKKRLDHGTKIVETSYSYSTNLALGLCAGPIEGVLRIWANDVLIYDRSVHNAGPIKLYPPPIRLYDGSENQIPDPLIQSIEGVNNVPAFKNLAYLVLENFPLHDFKNKIPHFQVEIISKAQEITKTKTLDLISEDFDNICISKTSPYLYLRDGNLIQKVHRFNEHVVCSKDLTDELPRTDLVASSLFGQMCLDQTSNMLYAFVQNQLSSFIVCINTFDLSITMHNFNERIIADESIGFIDKNNLYTADFLKGNIRVYDKKSLERHDYFVPGCLNSGLHQRPGNFTKDTDGNIWLVSHDPLDQKNFYLTKFQYGLDAMSTKIKHHGYATHIAYDHKTQRLIINSSEGLLRLNPKTFEIEAKIRFKNSIGNAHSSFLNHPILNGFIWSFNDKTGFLIDLITFKVEKKIPFSTLNIQAFGLSFDEDLNCLWSKGKGLHKTLLDRFDSSSCRLNEVVADVLRRGGIDDTFHDCDLNQEQVLGYVISEPQSIYHALQPLMSAYFFNLRSQAHKISFFHPDKQKIIKIDPKDLGAHEVDAYGPNNEDLILLKQPADQLPEFVICHYASYERFYENSCQEVHKGGHKDAHKTYHLSLPFLLTDAKAQQIAEKTLALSWMHAIECIFSLPPSYIFLEPGDLVEILHHERVYQLMIVSIDMGANYLLEIKAVLHHISAYESCLEGIGATLERAKMVFPPEIIEENQDQ
ncbi:MAG: phage tail protein [Alphaproteobacteria bacterium]|nr:phage tail protein [Alphaproteobacteria bacterium]